MIYFDRVSKIYNGGMAALDDVNISIEPGEFVSIVGHSGAGKTTLLRMLLAEEHPTSGSVFFESTALHAIPRNKTWLCRREMGAVCQEVRPLPHTVASAYA